MAGVPVVDVAARQVRTFSLQWALQDGPLTTALARWAIQKGHTPFLVVGRGPVAGAPVVGGQVATVTRISPLTPVLTEAKIEGSLARALRRLGLDAILVHGHARDWTASVFSDSGPS